MKTQDDLATIYKSISEDAKKIYYNAGRYVAGDRDSIAVADYYRYTVIEAAVNE
jgi:hypothetical protein